MKKSGTDFGLVAASTYLPSEIVGMTQDGTKEITALFGNKKFSYPKPVGLIKYLIEIATVRNPEALILDFFAGSGTTAQAVLELNQVDNGNRKFVLCTNNENGICEDITYPRIKTVITGKRMDESVYFFMCTHFCNHFLTMRNKVDLFMPYEKVCLWRKKGLPQSHWRYTVG